MKGTRKFIDSILNNKLKIAVIVTILMLTIGYAAINTTLNITGNIQLKRDSALKVFFKSVKLDGIDLESQISKDRESFIFKQSQIAELGNSSIDYEIINAMEDYDAIVNLTCSPEYYNYTSLSYSGEDRFIESGVLDAGTITTTTTKPVKLKLYDVIKNQSRGSESSLNYNDISSSTNGQGVYSTTNTDSGNEVYFFRGDISNNNVIYAGYCWQIIRTTETGGVKLLYNGEPVGGHCNPPSGNGILDISYNENSHDNAYVGYMYGNISSTYESTHTNLYDSMLKQEIDKWYEEHILGTEDETLLEDAVWCNDRSLYSGTGTGTKNTTYAFGGRVKNGSINPTLKCQRDEDKLTVASGYLKYPVATLTADEIIYAGAGGSIKSNDGTTTENPNMFLSSGGTFWTLTPQGYASAVHAHVVSFFGEGNLSTFYTDVAFRTMGVRPSVSIKPNVNIMSGEGSNESPYVIAMVDDSTDETEYVCSLKISLAEQEAKLIGKEYCFGTECFNIVDYDGENFKLLSKYNLYVGDDVSKTSPNYGHQDPTALGDAARPIVATVKYGVTNDYSTSYAKEYVDNYVDWLNETYNIDASGRLITTEELNELGCVLGASQGCGSAYNKHYEWVTRTTFYTGTPGSADDKIYIVGGDGFYNATVVSNANGRGIRPLIIVSKDKMTNIKIPADTMPVSWLDDGIFSEYYKKAYQKLKTLSPQEKIGQLLVTAYYSSEESAAYDAITNYNVGGLVLYEEAFTNKSIEEVQNMIGGLQSEANIPLMTAVDEEGGIVCRISTNTELVSEEMEKYPELFYTTRYNKNAWQLANTLYANSGNNFELVKKEEKVRNALLKKLGLNMNFAPVSDISSSYAYMADRSFDDDPDLVSQYVSAVVKAGKNSGVSHSLKHFPGYGNNSNTHIGSSIDNSSVEELYNIHLKPFDAGIKSGAETVMISHNIIAALDTSLPASLSPAVHSLLLDELQFTGLAITDDLTMDAIGDNYSQQYLKAFKAGNHLLLVSKQYETAYNELLSALENGEITNDELNKRVFRILAWKYYIGIIKD